MTSPFDPGRPTDEPAQRHPGHGGPKGHGGNGWMMIACCVPMLAIAVILWATGVVGVGFLVVALVCTVMMALMMGGMSHDGDGRA